MYLIERFLQSENPTCQLCFLFKNCSGRIIIFEIFPLQKAARGKIPGKRWYPCEEQGGRRYWESNMLTVEDALLIFEKIIELKKYVNIKETQVYTCVNLRFLYILI